MFYIAAESGASQDLITPFFQVTVPLSADDTLQGKSVQAAFQVYAEQLRNNP